jgi:hypothetical protein
VPVEKILHVPTLSPTSLRNCLHLVNTRRAPSGVNAGWKIDGPGLASATMRLSDPSAFISHRTIRSW